MKKMFGGESKMHKFYIVLYTCASTRAVHLDLVPSLDAQKFEKILCSKRSESVVYLG